MKVVLFCGGLGLRLREYSEAVPKPLVPIGQRPILWHVMKYFAHFGHNEFILCLGYRGEAVKQYFLDYKEALANDFVLSVGDASVELLSRDMSDWRITFVDTGVNASIGERLMAIRPHLGADQTFLASYSDGVTDLDLPSYLDYAGSSGKIATFVAVQSTQSFHVTRIGEDGSVQAVMPISDADLWINGGYFVFDRRIFDYIRPGEDLVGVPFERLIAEGALGAYRHKGFWMAMDTFKDKQALDSLQERGIAPWEMWRRHDGAVE